MAYTTHGVAKVSPLRADCLVVRVVKPDIVQPTAPEVTVDTRDALYVARQPILDERCRVFGYELLYRGAADETACSMPGDVASARVFTDAVLTVGLETLTNGRAAFLNVTKPLLLSPVSELLPPAAAVLELHEDIEIDAEVIDLCRQLHGAGYTLALDDFVPHSAAEALMPFVRFVKVDVLMTPAPMQADVVRRLRRDGVRFVAEKVETADAYEVAKAAGYSLFQGYFFCRPALRAAAAFPARQLAYLRLLAALNSPGVTIQQVETIVKHDPSLCFRVLRCVNSNLFGLEQEIHSIAQALVLLGLDRVRKWASLWCVAGLNNGEAPELITIALVRARTCELLASELDLDDRALFLVGLCSLLDAMLGRPMDEALRELPLPREAKQALLGFSNPSRLVLDAVTCYERGAWDDAAAAAASAGLRGPMLAAAYQDALRWARELTREGAEAR
jgi:EAL and modified HD-GYP domain-containing signal transduction protein